MGIAPSHRPVHVFPPPPAQLSHITPRGEDEHKMDIAMRLTERVESWFGTEHSLCLRDSIVMCTCYAQCHASVFHSRVSGTVSGQDCLGLKVPIVCMVLTIIKGSPPQGTNGGLCRVPIPRVLTPVSGVPLQLPLPFLRGSILISGCFTQHSTYTGQTTPTSPCIHAIIRQYPYTYTPVLPYHHTPILPCTTNSIVTSPSIYYSFC